MGLLGTHLNVLIGAGVPLPAPIPFLQAIEKVEVHAADQGRSGFQITLRTGRGRTDILEEPLLLLPQMKLFSRVVLTASVGPMPTVIIDGMLTNIQHQPGAQGQGTLVLTGEDISIMMDLEEKTAEHPAQPEIAIAALIIAQYAMYGLIPLVIPPPSMDIPIPTDRTPTQQGTDFAYLNTMAGRYGYVFYIKPGPAPLVNMAYWGPPERVGMPQRGLCVDMGPFTNVLRFDVENDGMATAQVQGNVQDRSTNQSMPVRSVGTTRPPLAAQPAWLTQSNQRVVQFRESGHSSIQALARAQATADRAADRVVRVRGELDVARYGQLLSPRSIVGVRGLGFTGDGLYYVKNVTHMLQHGSYHQQFELEREGTGAITPVVVP
jgi:hypothetical protein